MYAYTMSIYKCLFLSLNSKVEFYMYVSLSKDNITHQAYPYISRLSMPIF